MEVLIRTDASIDIGSGHVMRCLTIAQALKKQGFQVTFWMQPMQGDLIDYVKQQFPVTQTVFSVDILIIDHYQLNAEWERAMRNFARKIIVIDDLANRRHDCDLLLDQNVVANYERRYDELVSEYCRKLLGPAYLIMRDEFIEARTGTVVRKGSVKRLLVFMGGSDPTAETLKILDALEQLLQQQSLEKFLPLDLEHIDVVVGSSNAHGNVIKQRCRELGLHYHCQINYLAELMRQADFAIGAGGSSMWERCFVGLPSSSTVVAHNQQASTDKAAELGAIIHLGWHEEVSSVHYLELLKELPLLDEKLSTMSKQGLYITGGQGATNAWLREMVELIHDKNRT